MKCMPPAEHVYIAEGVVNSERALLMHHLNFLCAQPQHTTFHNCDHVVVAAVEAMEEAIYALPPAGRCRSGA